MCVITTAATEVKIPQTGKSFLSISNQSTVRLQSNHNFNSKRLHSPQKASVQSGELTAEQFAVCRREIRCHTVITFQSAHTNRAEKARSLPPQSTRLHEVNRNKLQCKYLFVMTFNEGIFAPCYRQWGMMGEAETLQVRARCEARFYLFSPADWIQFSGFQLINSQRTKLCDTCWFTSASRLWAAHQFPSHFWNATTSALFNIIKQTLPHYPAEGWKCPLFNIPEA